MPQPTSSSVSAAGALLAFALASSRALAESPLPPPAAAGRAPVATWTRLRIVTTTPVVLERRQGSLPTDPPPPPRAIYADSDPVWQAVCSAPCDTAVQLGGEYRIGGEGVTSSSPFALHGPSTELRVDPGSSGVRRASVYFMVIGILGAAAGGIFLGVDALHGGGLDTGGYASIGGLVAGGVLGLTGVGMYAGGGTSVRDEARHDLASTERPLPPTLHATFRF